MSVTEPMDPHRHAEPAYRPDSVVVPNGSAPEAGPVYLAPAPNRLGQFLLRLQARAPRWSAPVVVAACFAGAASYVWISNPTDGGASDIPTCIVKLTTGLDCPGCGGTRAFYFLMHGNLPEAARHHAMAVFVAPLLVWYYLAWTVKHIWGKQLAVPRLSAKTLSIFLGIWAAFMVARNLPFAPFTSLYV